MFPSTFESSDVVSDFDTASRGFRAQRGACYYCSLPMWLSDIAECAKKNGLTMRQADALRATAEHLTARQNGGGSGDNIVAACWCCNFARHAHRLRAPIKLIRRAGLA